MHNNYIMIELYISILLFALGNYLNNQNTTGEINKSDILEMPNDPKPSPPQKIHSKVPHSDYKNSKLISTKQIANKSKIVENFSGQEEGELDVLERKGFIELEADQRDEIVDRGEGFQIKSELSGEIVENFMNNSDGEPFIPYLKGRHTQNMSEISPYTRKLERFTGREEYDISKKEQEPFFETFIDQNTNGFENINTQTIDRYIPSQDRRNELPFDQVQVGPGINAGAGCDPKGNFHDIEWVEAAMPKTIDELRAANNPKLTYKGRIIKGKSSNDTRVSTPNLKTYKTDTFEVVQDVDRSGAYGSADTIKETYKDGIFTNTTTGNRSKSGDIGPARSSTDRHTIKVPLSNCVKRNILGPYKNNIKTNLTKKPASHKQSFFAKPNERDITQGRTHKSNIITAVKSLIVPIQDKIKTTKKENMVGNNRPEGNFNSSVPKKQTVYDPNDIARTTIKETTIDNDHTGYIQKGPGKLTAYDPNDIARTTIKETNIDNEREGNVTLDNKKPQIYDKDTQPKITIRETLDEVDYSANVSPSGPKNHKNYDNYEAPTTIRETTSDNEHASNVSYKQDGGYMTNEQYAPATSRQFMSDYEYTGNANDNMGMGYATNEMNAPATSRQFLSDYEYTGNANSADKKPMSEDSSRNARTNANKELISKGRAPTQTSVKVSTGMDAINVMNKRQSNNDTAQNRVEISRIENINPGQEIINFTQNGEFYENINSELIDPVILDAFKSNPYTQSLESWA